MRHIELLIPISYSNFEYISLGVRLIAAGTDLAQNCVEYSKIKDIIIMNFVSVSCCVCVRVLPKYTFVY